MSVFHAFHQVWLYKQALYHLNQETKYQNPLYYGFPHTLYLRNESILLLPLQVMDFSLLLLLLFAPYLKDYLPQQALMSFLLEAVPAEISSEFQVLRFQVDFRYP